MAPTLTEPEAPPVELSPFVISADSDIGYVATSSLAGSRLKTDLKDIAAPIDVLTPEFLDDVAATNISDAVEYTPSVDGPSEQNIGPNEGVDSTRIEARARGFDRATQSSDFFATAFPGDFYNVDRVTVANGPQSILFGLGNAGGVLDLTTKAGVFRNFGSYEARIDDRGAWRHVLDLNRRIVPRKLAVRLLALHNDRLSFIEGGYNTQQRITGTVTYRPARSTTLRVHYEHLDQRVSNTTNFVSQDFLSPWDAAGRPLFDNARGPGAPLNATTDPLSLFERTGNPQNVFSYGATSPAGSSLQTAWNGSVVTRGPHQQPGAEDRRPSALLDGSIYPLDRDPRVDSRVNDIYGDQVRIFWEQRLAEDLFIEFAANSEQHYERSGGAFNQEESINIFADANRYLPGGTNAAPQTALNPNAGQLYIETFPHATERIEKTKEARLTGAYEYDFAKKNAGRARWLGRHRFASLLSVREDESRAQQDRALVVGEPAFANGGKLNDSRFLRTRYYLGGDLLSAGPIPGGADAIFGPWTLQHPTTGESYTVALLDNPEGRAFLPNGTRTRIDTQMIALQSLFVGNRINAFYGIRRDDVRAYKLRPDDLVRRDYLAPGDRQGLFLPLREAEFDGTPLSDDVGISQTLGLVVHPRRWLSLHYNKSENFALPPGLLDPYGQSLPGTYSDGHDFGFRLTFGEGFFVRVNFFREMQHANISSTIQDLRDSAAMIETALRGPNRPANIGPIEPDGFDPVARPVGDYRAVEGKEAKGTEIVFVARPTRQWNLRLAVGHQKTVVVDKALAFREWIAGRRPVWENAGGLGWNNVPVSRGDARSLRTFYQQAIQPDITALELQSGQERFRQRPWRANFFTNYRFTGERLKGFSLGGGARWFDRANLGFATMTLPDTNIRVLDTSRPYRSDTRLTVDAVAAYQRPLRISGTTVRWRLQLNIRNLLDDDDLEVLRAKNDGTPLDVGRVAGRQFIVANKFSF